MKTKRARPSLSEMAVILHQLGSTLELMQDIEAHGEKADLFDEAFRDVTLSEWMSVFHDIIGYFEHFLTVNNSTITPQRGVAGPGGC